MCDEPQGEVAGWCGDGRVWVLRVQKPHHVRLVWWEGSGSGNGTMECVRVGGGEGGSRETSKGSSR